MASKQELIQAQKFSRRRLLTAFVSGAPGGRELAPTKPLRGVVLGSVLAVLVLLGTLIAGVFTGGLDEGWENSSIVTVKDEGTRYVAINGTLYPVLNLSSARLITSTTEVVEADAEDLDGMERAAAPRGIEGAPDALPVGDRLLGGVWTACAAPEAEVATGVGPSAALPAEDVAVLVSNEDRYFYVTGGYRYEVSFASLSALQLTLGLDSTEVTEVSAGWLNLYEQGTPLAPVVFGQEGQPAGGAAGDLDLQVGQLIEVVDSTQDRIGMYVVSEDSSLAPISDFALEIYALGVQDESLMEPRQLTAGDVEAIERDDAGLFPTDWPEQRPEPVTGTPCARLDTEAEEPDVTLTQSPDPVTAGVAVEPGHAVLVAAGDSGDGNTWGFIDERGTYFPVAAAEDVERLGYTTDTATAVPAAWVRLFPQGPELSQAAAMGST